MNALYADVNGQRFHYYEWGSKKKPTIVCFHGLGNTALSFWELAEMLKCDFHVLAFDHPGHGNTPSFHDENQYLFINMAERYDAVFQQLIDSPFMVLGHSWGADIALNCTIRSRQRIRGTILLDGGFTFPVYEPGMSFSVAYDGWSTYMDKTKYGTVEDILKEYKGYTHRWNERIQQMVLSMFRLEKQYKLATSRFTVLSIIKAFFTEPFSTTYPHISVPLLLLHATIPENNAAREKGITELKNCVQNATIVPIHNAGHLVHWDNPDQVCFEIKKWASDAVLN